MDDSDGGRPERVLRRRVAQIKRDMRGMEVGDDSGQKLRWVKGKGGRRGCTRQRQYATNQLAKKSQLIREKIEISNVNRGIPTHGTAATLRKDSITHEKKRVANDCSKKVAGGVYREVMVLTTGII